MADTKSGVNTPVDPPNKPLTAPVKVYADSSKIGKGNSGGSDIISGPASKK